MSSRRLIAVTAVLALLPVAGLPSASASSSAGSSPPRPVACDRPTDQESGSSALHTITSGGIERSYILRLPRGYDRKASWPLVVAYHGRGSTGTEIEGFSELSTLPAVVAYPDGVVGTGDGYRQAWQGAPYAPVGVDDVAFTEDLLDELQSDLCVDPTRTYATGKSNGAGLVGLLACRLPERFAAVAPVAGAFYPGAREGCEDAPAVPVLDVHGVADATIPYEGDVDRDLPAIRDWVAEWAERDGCRPTPRTGSIGRDVLTYRFAGCDDGAAVEHVAIEGGGHVWPGADVYSGGGHVTHTIEASEVIWRFFRQHRLTQVQR